MAPNANANANAPIVVNRKLPQHGIQGAYYGGDWVDLEDCANTFFPPSHSPTSDVTYRSKCDTCPNQKKGTCSGGGSGGSSNGVTNHQVRSRSKLDSSKDGNGKVYDVVIVGAGCIGSAIARELSKYQVSVLMVEAADDVSQGATKGNSGIVHAGYDDKPNTNRSKYCWDGNQMFPTLDRELRFGYQTNGSLVLATNETEVQILKNLMTRGEMNGVKRLQLLNQTQVLDMEPGIHPNTIAALFAPDAGNVIPYEYAIALAENAVDNGVEVRIRREVVAINKKQEEEQIGDGDLFDIQLRHWEPSHYVESKQKYQTAGTTKNIIMGSIFFSTSVMVGLGVTMALDSKLPQETRHQSIMAVLVLLVSGILAVVNYFYKSSSTSGGDGGRGYAAAGAKLGKMTTKQVVDMCQPLEGNKGGSKVNVEEMFTGGSGSIKAVKGVVVGEEHIQAKYIINCAGGASDKIANMIGDYSFKIKPRLGDYLLLNRNQGYLTSKTIFPCPDPVLGKGVLVQTTLWGNLILGPTARDTYKPEARDMADTSVQEYILSKCKKLCPYFDPKEAFHAFCGARAKSDRGDWIIERSSQDGNFVHVAGIDSPGLAGSPAIAVDVIRLLQEAGLDMVKDPTFNPTRAPIIAPKKGMRGLKMGPVGKNDWSGSPVADEEKRMASNVVCKCEKVTELEIVTALRRSLPIDSSQAIRKRTRAGMGHCQGEAENYNCECRVKAIIARENRIPIESVGGRPWPATSTLSERWIKEEEKSDLEERSK